jgi:hypothetical protein
MNRTGWLVVIAWFSLAMVGWVVFTIAQFSKSIPLLAISVVAIFIAFIAIARIDFRHWQ